MFEKVYVEISNICNLKCDFCPAVERSKKIVSLESFENTILQVKDHTKRVCLHLMGEPLGHPHFNEIMAICEKHNISVELTSNGVLIVPNKWQTLFSRAIVQLNISVHSFEANHKQKDVGPYLDKIFGLVDVLEKERPDMYVNYRIWDLQDETSLTDKNKEIRNRVEEKYTMKFSDLKIDIRRKKGYNLRGRVYIHFDSRFEWPEMKLPEINKSGFCHALSHHVGIHADGTVVACCLDKEANLALGNINEKNFIEILASPRATQMKTGFEKNILTEDLCKRCSYIKRF